MTGCCERDGLRCRVFSFFVAAALLLPGAAAAADPPREVALSELFPGAVFDPSIPTQQAALGVTPGARPLRHAEVKAYLETLAAASPRATILPYAQSHEGRALYVVAISDAATIADLDAFREAHAVRMDPRRRPAAQDAQALSGHKAVAWIAYGIHGDELSSVDAAVAVTYRLIAGEDGLAERIRDELVVLIDPMENPDGRERFLSQIFAFQGRVPNPDTEDISHTSVWPWGRGNHYLFDLNRDWFSLVHPESARSGVIASWNPQLMVDSHEMGSDDTYLFSPARHPFNPHKGEHVRRWWDRFAADQGRALDRRGYGYYTREWNEEFFPGYGSSWASYIGSIGILYEMSGTEGTLVKKREGVVRSYAQAVEHQVTSSVANLTTLLDNREELLRDYVASRREAVEQGQRGKIRAWVLPMGRYPERTEWLAAVLVRQGVEVLRLAGGPVEAGGLHDIRTGEARTVSLPSQSFLIPLDQPAGRLARVLLDPHVPMESGFLHEQREYIERGKGSRLYDTTAWSLILSFGIEAYWSGAKPPGNWKPVGPPSDTILAQSLPPAEQGALFAYAFDGTSDNAAFALGDLLQRGLRVRVADKPFRVAGRSFERGSVLVEREGNPADLADQVSWVATRRGIEVVPIGTSRAEQGPDLGGRHFNQLVAPRVGVLTGMPISPSAYGSIWYLLDYNMGLRFSALDIGRFLGVDLSRYNVLVFPPSFFGAQGYKHLLGEPGLSRLEEWIGAGGTAIGIGNGAQFLADSELGWTATRLRRQALDKYPPVVWGIGPEEAERGGRFRAAGLRPPEEPEPEGSESENKAAGKRKGAKPASAAPAARKSPYDVAPVIGPGARPFVEGVALGTPVTSQPVGLAEWVRPLLPPGQGEPEPGDLDRADARLRELGPEGAFLRAELDPERWLTWGLGESVDVLLRTSTALVAEPPVEVAARFADVGSLHLGGLLWPEAAGRVAHTAYATREGVGRGQVILFVDEPNFRAWTLGTRRMLVNAILYGPGLGTEWSTPW